MAQICIGEEISDDLTCKRIPERIFKNATFVVDFTSGIEVADITTDAVVYTGHSCPVEKVSDRNKIK